MEASRHMGRRASALLSLVALSCHRGVVRADDTLNSVVSEAFGESCRSFFNSLPAVEHIHILRSICYRYILQLVIKKSFLVDLTALKCIFLFF